MQRACLFAAADRAAARGATRAPSVCGRGRSSAAPGAAFVSEPGETTPQIPAGRATPGHRLRSLVIGEDERTAVESEPVGIDFIVYVRKHEGGPERTAPVSRAHPDDCQVEVLALAARPLEVS